MVTSYIHHTLPYLFFDDVEVNVPQYGGFFIVFVTQVFRFHHRFDLFVGQVHRHRYRQHFTVPAVAIFVKQYHLPEEAFSKLFNIIKKLFFLIPPVPQVSFDVAIFRRDIIPIQLHADLLRLLSRFLMLSFEGGPIYRGTPNLMLLLIPERSNPQKQQHSEQLTFLIG